MSALRQPDFSTDYYASKPQPLKHKYQEQKRINQPRRKIKQVVMSRDFSQSRSLPQNLKILSLIQHGSFVLALASMATSIGVYISTVKIPDIWSQEYQNLENLQRQERQLVSINETMKYQIAKEAGKNKDLSISKPESALFISPTQVEPRIEPRINQHRQELVNLKYSSLGY